MAEKPGHGIKSVTRIGDCIAPGTIAAAVFSGRRYAEDLDRPASTDLLAFRSEPLDLRDTSIR